MKKSARAVIAVCCAICVALSLPAAYAKGFSDVPADKWYSGFIDEASNKGLMNGVGNNNFAPNAPLTRAMFVQILANMNGVNTSNNNVSTVFTDVPSGKWYTAAVKWAYENKVVNGLTATTFGPDKYVERQQACTMFFRYAMKLDMFESIGMASFPDNDQISSYAFSGVSWCEERCIVFGMDDGKFYPKASTTRAQMAKMILRFNEDVQEWLAVDYSGYVGYYTMYATSEEVPAYWVNVEKAIDRRSIVVSVGFIGPSYSPIVETEPVTAEMFQPGFMFDWEDSGGNKGYGLLELEEDSGGKYVNIDMHITDVVQGRFARLGTDGWRKIYKDKN